MKIRYYVQWEKIKLFCVEYNLYTCGNTTEYAHLLFDLCDRGKSTQNDLLKIANDIYIIIVIKTKISFIVS